MARAKRTDRAEARRRHRAEATKVDGDATPEPETDATTPPRPDRPGRPGQPPTPPPRPGVRSAFRSAFRPLDLRGDLAFLPRLIIHRAVYIPVAVTILATALVIGTDAVDAGTATGSPSPSASAVGSGSPPTSASPAPSTSPPPSASASPSGASASPAPSASAGASPSASVQPSPSPAPSAPAGPTAGPLQTVGVILFQFFVATPPVAAAFISGFLAPRASWLAGLITALVAVVCIAVAGFASPTLDATARTSLITQALVISPVSGALYAAAAAWYKRFLELANPNRAARAQAASRKAGSRQARSRSNARRR